MTSNNIIKNRYEFVYLFDVKDGNPNGDPDAGNFPRTDPETGHGLVTDVCLKRKIRDIVPLMKAGGGDTVPAGYDIYVRHHSRGGLALNAQHKKAYDALGMDPKKEEKGKKRDTIAKARKWMCDNFYDIRTFGAVMGTEINCGQVRGPVQINFARSVDPILSMEHCITRVAFTQEEKAETTGGVSEMGRKTTVPYAIYRAHGFISPNLAADTGFTEDDLALLWEALETMFDHDHSASRGEMHARKLIIFKHESALGNAPSHKLFDSVQVKRKDAAKPPRSFEDYQITIDKGSVPSGVTIDERL